MEDNRQATIAARGMADPLNRLRAIGSTLAPIIEKPCSHCAPQAAASRVTLHRKPWGNSPVPYLGGPISDLITLAGAGMAERRADGWFIPTSTFPGL